MHFPRQVASEDAIVCESSKSECTGDPDLPWLHTLGRLRPQHGKDHCNRKARLTRLALGRRRLFADRQEHRESHPSLRLRPLILAVGVNLLYLQTYIDSKHCCLKY